MFDKILKFAFPPFPTTRASVGLLVLRLLTGFGIMLHGYGKLGAAEGFAAGVGVPVFMAWMAILTEFIGGILIILGALTPLVSLMLTGNMAYAAFHHFSKGDGFLLKPSNGMYEVGYEFASLYLVAFFAILMAGPGKLALDYLIFRKKIE